jgi:hypothetical protein
MNYNIRSHDIIVISPKELVDYYVIALSCQTVKLGYCMLFSWLIYFHRDSLMPCCSVSVGSWSPKTKDIYV